MKPDPSTTEATVAKALTWESFSNLVCFGLAFATFGNLERLRRVHGCLLHREADPVLFPRKTLASNPLWKGSTTMNDAVKKTVQATLGL